MKLARPHAFIAAELFTITLLIGGCAVGPDYRPPAPPAKTTYRQASLLDRYQQSTTTPSSAPWWRSFNDPVLARVVENASVQNLDLAQADARIMQARAGTKAAFANLVPSGNISADAARTHQSLEDPLGRVQASTPNFNRNSYYYDTDLNVGWEIDVFGGRRREIQSARAQYQAAQASRAAVELAVTAEAADTYVLVRALQARIALVRDQIHTQQDRVRLIGTLFNRGLTPQSQFDEAKGILATTAAVEPELELNLVSARNSLDVLLGRAPGTPDTDLDNIAAIPVSPSIDTATGPADLVRRRPDLVVAERRLASSNAQIGTAISEYYPKFSLSGLFGSATTFNGHLFNDASEQATGALGLRWRLFDFGRIDAEVKVARGRNTEALAAYRQSVLRATAEVEDSFAAVAYRQAQEHQLRDGESSLTQARAAILAAYKSGTNSYLDLLDIDSRVQQIQDARIVAQSNATRAAIESFRALGGGWSIEAPPAPAVAKN